MQRKVTFFATWRLFLGTFLMYLGCVVSNPLLCQGNYDHLIDAEYFIGLVDPGEGEAIPLTHADGDWDEMIEHISRTDMTWDNLPSPSLLQVRVKSSNGTWGPLFKKTIWPFGSQLVNDLLASSDSLTLCYGDSLEVLYSGPDAYTPLWWDGSAGQSAFIETDSSQWWVMQATDGVDIAMDSVYVRVFNQTFIPTEPSGYYLICSASQAFSIEALGSFVNLQWSLNGVEAAGESNSAISVLQAGSYSVSGIQADTGCPSESIPVTVEGSPELQFTCHPNLGSIVTVNEFVSSTGSIYQWMYNGVEVGQLAYVNVVEAGVYSLELVNNDCAASLSITILEEDLLEDCVALCEDLNGDGLCDNTQDEGCITPSACNYDADADINDGSCSWPLPGQYCDGSCVNDSNGNGICDENEISGCTSTTAINFSADAAFDDGTCEFSSPEIKMSACECFLGDDPGLGNGVSFDASDTEWDESFERVLNNIVSPDLDGAVIFSARCQDNGGVWGALFSKVIFGNGGISSEPDSTDQGGGDGEPVVDGSIIVLPTLIKGEYFFGVFDPGEGQGAPIASLDGNWDESMERMIREQLTWDQIASPTFFNLRVQQETLGDLQWGPLFRMVVWPSGSTSNVSLLEADSLSVCQGEVLTLTYSGPSAHVPTWPDGSNGATWDADTDNTHWIAVTATDGQSLIEDSVHVSTITPPSAATEPSGVVLGCPSQPLFSIEALSSGLEYEWTLDGGFLSDNPLVNVTALGGYQLSVIDNSTGCVNTSEVVMVVYQPEITLICSQETGWTLTMGSSGSLSNASAAWTLDGGEIGEGGELYIQSPGLYRVTLETDYCNGAASLMIEATDIDGGCLIGCFDVNACNYNEFADVEAEECDYTSCIGICDLDVDGDGVCDNDEILGCSSSFACNYDLNATDDDGSCVFPPEGFGCDGSCLDSDSDGVCDTEEVGGCTDANSPNYDSLATDDDGTCSWTPAWVVEGEYFLGDDPGEGLGTSLNAIDEYWDEALERLIKQDDLWDAVDSISLLSLRVKGMDGVWGPTFKKVLWGPSLNYEDDDSTGDGDNGGGDNGGGGDVSIDTLTYIAEAEYFVGIFDPGVGEGIPLNANDETFDESVERLLRSQFLWNFNGGPTMMNVRVKTSEGEWSNLFRKVIWSEGEEEGGIELIVQGDSLAVCTGESVTIDFEGPNTFTPVWFNGSTELSITFEPQTSGDYVVTSTDGVGVLSDTIHIEVLDLPLVSIDPSGIVYGCTGSESFPITASGDGVSYTWYEDGEVLATDSFFMVTKSGSYFVEVIDLETGCISQSELVVVVDSLNPQLNCIPLMGWVVDLGTIGETSSSTILWKNLVTGEILDSGSYFMPSGPGEFEVSITNGFCSDSEIFTLSPTEFAGGCSASEIPGCTSSESCNYNAIATVDDGSCNILDALGVCGGECLSDIDGDGVCDTDEIFGCADCSACNFDPQVTENTGCEYSVFGYDCEGTCLLDIDSDGICDTEEILGCQDPTACNFDPTATSPGFCAYPSFGEDCTGNCISDTNEDGVCDALELYGCMDSQACNFNSNATTEADCYFAPSGYNCNGDCLNDSNNNGICDELEEVLGCNGPDCCGANSLWDSYSQSCIANGPQLCGENTIWDPITQSCVGYDDCPGDLDGNETINTTDLLIFLSVFGSFCN